MPIKMIAFDLDGVLVEARNLHYEALNNALIKIGKQYVINREEHLARYDGLPTKKKLAMLTEQKGLPEEAHEQVWKDKQIETIHIINQMEPDHRICQVLSELRDCGYLICVASNSVRDTIRMMLLRKGFMEYIHFFLSNQDVMQSKPNPEIYLRCMVKAGIGPRETLIVEDSHVGRKSAEASGAHVCGVNSPDDIKMEMLSSFLEGTVIKEPKWQGRNMNILIPMAGAGKRFEQAGYSFPKPLIDVNGKPMIQLVVDNLNIDAKFIFVVQEQHYNEYHLQFMLNAIVDECEIVLVDRMTEGAACTTLLAESYIDNDDPLLIANSDQFIEWNSNEFMYAISADEIDGAILTFESNHPKWSYAKLDDNGYVSEVAEKKVISNLATVGVYYWRKGSDYVKYSKEMIEENIRVNNEFYVCPVYNQAIRDGLSIKAFNIQKMWGLGTPEDLERFLNQADK